MVVKLGQCGGGEAVVRRSSLEPEHRQFGGRRSSFFVRTHASRVYFSPHFIFVGAPVVFVNIFRCQLISCVKMCSCSGNNPSYMWMSSI